VTVQRTVWCGGCGKQLDEPSSTTAGERIVCPNCGSQVRKFGVEITAAVEVRAGVRGKGRRGEAGKPGGSRG
jgi:DNA-directed RNA polymerase subunit RPC12/RpoP